MKPGMMRAMATVSGAITELLVAVALVLGFKSVISVVRSKSEEWCPHLMFLRDIASPCGN